MRFMGWICTLALSVGAATASAADNCISTNDMQEIAKAFPQFDDLASKGEYCPDGSHEARLLQGIMFMRNTPFAPEMPKSADELFSGTFAKDWWGYFTGRINEFDIQDSCPKGVVAFVYGFGGNTMYVCPLALTDQLTSLDLSSVFMHEARHIDGYPHITCTRGPRAGISGACDQRISDTGSYAVTVETYAQLGRYAQDLHPALKAYARASAVIYADEAFQTPVKIDRTSQFLLLTNDSQFYQLNGSDVKALGQAPALGHLVMRAQFMILFPDDKTKTAEFVFANNEGGIQQTAGDAAAEYNAATPAQRADLVDVHISAQWIARVYKNKVRFTCDPRSQTASEVSLPDGEMAASLLYPTGYDRAARLVNLISTSGHMLEIGCDQNYSPFVRTSNLKLDQTYKRVHKAGDDVLGLTADGRLFKLNGMTSTPVQTAVDGKIYDLVPNQRVEFFDSVN